MFEMHDCWDLMRKIETAQNDASYHAKELDKENALLANLTGMLAAALRKLPANAMIVYGDRVARLEGSRVVMYPGFSASSVKLALEVEDDAELERQNDAAIAEHDEALANAAS